MPTQVIRAAFLALSAALAFAQTPADVKAPPPKYDPAAVDRGHSLFVKSCGFCHGSNAKGGEKGPDLLRSVLVLDDDNGKAIAPVILKGRPEKGMPRFPFTAAQISDIANFLHQSILSAADRDSYKILNIVSGNAQAGAAYFNGAGHCASCHSVTGDLKGIGAKYEPVTLQGRFLAPPFTWSEGTPPKPVAALSLTVMLASGQSYTGTLMNLDDFNAALRTADGTFHSFRIGPGVHVRLDNRLQAHVDQLPHYTDADIHNLTAYLVTLK